MHFWKDEGKSLAWIAGGFLALYFVPLPARMHGPVYEALALAQWYAREHVILCLVPAFFIAGAISVFVRQGAVIRYLGANAPRVVAYAVASVSGSVLAVCSCTVLPLFAGIYRRGAGIGPATAFLYSGPAINVLAVILTARVLGVELGVARAVGAVVFSVVVGLVMHACFGRGDARAADVPVPAGGAGRPAWQDGVFVAAMVPVLVAATWSGPGAAVKWWVTSALGIGVVWPLAAWYGVRARAVLLAAVPVVVLALVFPQHPVAAFAAAVVMVSVLAVRAGGDAGDWFESSWGFARQIMPLLFAGVLVAGLLLGRPGHEGLIPASWVNGAVGGNTLRANLFASVVGAFMYFATLTEIPILQGLMGAGMGKGPALALLLAGPALSLPNMLVIRGVLGTRRTAVFVLVVVVMATLSGMIFGAFAG